MGDVHAERLAAEVSRANERIRQLEELNKTLAAEVDRMRPVIGAATKVIEYQQRVSDSFAWKAVDDLRLAQLTYESSKPK